MHNTASNPYLRAKFAVLSFDDEIMNLEFELNYPIDDETDIYFVSELLAKGMVVEWLEPQVKNVLFTKQFFGGKEEKFYAQANQLSQMQALLHDAKIELRKMIRDYGYLNNSYIGEE